MGTNIRTNGRRSGKRSGWVGRLAPGLMAALAAASIQLSAAPAHAVAPPTAFFNPAPSGGGRNVALLEAGATVDSRSSQYDFWHSPQAMLNYLTYPDDFYPWATGSGQTTNQWVKLLLAGGGTYLIDRVRVQPRPVSVDQRVKDFAIDVSTTTADDAAFTTVLSATAANNGNLQEFVFPQPALAKYVRYRAINNRGSTCCISTQQLKVVTGQQGGRTVTFQNLSTDPDGDIVSSLWDFGDASPTSTEQGPTHTFPAGPGSYTVSLTVTDATGNTHTSSLVQRVLVPPAVSFTFSPAVPNEGQWITFTGTATDPDGGTILRRVWNWGDGQSTTSSATSVSHIYGDNSNYAVTLTVVDDQEQTGQAQATVTVLNVPPSVNMGADRRWVSGERLAFSPSVYDPGWLDARICQLNYGDGSPLSPSCFFDRTYSVPVGSPARAFTSSLTVTDDDGGVGSDSMVTTVFPQMFRNLGTTSISSLLGIDWSTLADKLVIAWNQTCSTRVSLVGLDGTLRHVTSSIAKQCNETDVAVSPGLGGFGLGDVFLGNGRAGEIARVRMDAGGALTGLANPWVTVPTTGRLGGVAFDDAGAFGYDLVTVWTDGKIYRVKSDGTFSLVANLNRFLEGADVAAPAGFGPASGCLLTTDAWNRNVWAACPSGAPFLVTNIAGASYNLETLSFVPSAGDYFFVDPDRGRVYVGDSRSFTGALTGHVLVGTQYHGEVWDLSYDPASNTYRTGLFTLAMREGGLVHFEGAAFLSALGSANSSLTPRQVTRPVGADHTVTATIKDSSGNPVSNLQLTFTVTGANPTSGTAVTDASGVAAFTYTGANTGVDTIVASSSNAATKPAVAVWILRGTTLVANPAIAQVSQPGGATVFFPNLSARLTEASTSSPIAGRTIDFYATDPTGARALVCSATTDADGLAACGGAPGEAAAVLGRGYEAVFAGDARYVASSGTAPLLRVSLVE